jgi:hypothetical protein
VRGRDSQLVRATPSGGVERLHRTPYRCGVCQPVRKKGDVEAGVVDDQFLPANGFPDVRKDLSQGRLPADHVVADAMHLRGLPGDGPLGIHQGIDQRPAIVVDDRNFDDRVAAGGAKACRFRVEVDVHIRRELVNSKILANGFGISRCRFGR